MLPAILCFVVLFILQYSISWYYDPDLLNTKRKGDIMKKILKILAIASVAFITSCASVAPTTETYTGYRIYRVSSDYNLTQVRNAVLSAAKELNDNAQVTNRIPPHPLPAKPGRFKIKEMSFGPVTMEFPQTPGATVSVQSSNDPTSRESIKWVAGIYPYTGGYSVQIVMTTGLDPLSVGAALGEAIRDHGNGGTEGRAKEWFDAFSKKIKAKVNMKLEESYPQS